MSASSARRFGASRTRSVGSVLGLGWRTPLASAALLTIVLLVLLGLWAVDRALTRSRRTQTALQAVEIASIIDAFLAGTSSALAATRTAASIVGDTAMPQAYGRIAEAILEADPAFTALWLADSGGHVLTWRARAVTPAPIGLDLDTLVAVGEPMSRARGSSRVQVSAPISLGTERSIMLIETARTQSGLRAFVGGLVSIRALEDVIRRSHAKLPAIVHVHADTVTVVEMGGRRGEGLYHATASLDFPAAQSWTVEVGQPRARFEARVALWAIGAIAVTGLLIGILQERRQTERLSARSAELERLSAELLEANRAKSEFLANVSHELRTPLTAIVGFVDLLRDGVYGDLGPRQVLPVERIAASANHLRHLVDQVLDIARMAAGRLELHTESIALRPFVLDVMGDLEALINEKGLAVSIAVSATLPRVQTDPVHLRQILLNLIANAVKYTPAGTVAVRSRLVMPGTNDARPETLADTTPWVVLQVSDTGIGIAPENLGRIFEEFEQVDPGSRGQSAIRGTGLGLSISRRLARVLGGDIAVTSELGKGSTFSLWLPVDLADATGAAPEVSDRTGA